MFDIGYPGQSDAEYYERHNQKLLSFQEETNRIVKRIEALVAIHGGQSDTLAEVRKWYEIFQRCPENFSQMVLEKEVEKIENLRSCEPQCPCI